MARPRVVHMESGATIVIRGATPEEAQRIKNLLLGVSENVASVPINAERLPSVALGSFKDAEGWRLVKVRFNGLSGEARVESVSSGTDKGECFERFRIEAIKNEFV